MRALHGLNNLISQSRDLLFSFWWCRKSEENSFHQIQIYFFVEKKFVRMEKKCWNILWLWYLEHKSIFRCLNKNLDIWKSQNIAPSFKCGRYRLFFTKIYNYVWYDYIYIMFIFQFHIKIISNHFTLQIFFSRLLFMLIEIQPIRSLISVESSFSILTFASQFHVLYSCNSFNDY